MTLAKQAELEISLRNATKGLYAIEYRFRQPGSQAEVRLGQEQPVVARLDLQALRSLVDDPASYARQLSQDFFADPAGRALFSRARATAAALRLSLRIRLSIAADAAELHAVYWETLVDPEDGQPLFTGENISFARYLSSQDWRPVQLLPKKSLSALVVVANPADLPPEQRIDAPAELARAIQELGTIQSASLGVEADGPAATLENLAETLRQHQPDILYLICHGAMSKGEPYLMLEDERRAKQIVRGDELVARLSDLARPPLLVVLASCQSAGRPGSADARLALGPRLAQAGVSAVIAMQGDVSQETVAAFMPAFFRALSRDGHLEYAMSLARGRVRQRLDYWMPALFTRLEGETIFAPRVIPWTGYGFAALGALILALLAAGVWYTRRETPMSGGFNLAVAEFTVEDAGGKFVSTEPGRQFSASLFRTLEGALTNVNIPGAVQPELRPPERTKRVEGDTPQAREAQAQRLAEKLQATILIYGVIRRDAQGYQVEPAFYVNNLGWDYGGEVAGPQRLGQPLPVDLSGDIASQFTQNASLEARVRALKYLVDGLSYYHNQQFDLAAGFFQQAADESGWNDEEGKEVVYMLLGAAWLRAYQPGSLDFAALERSRRAFERAVSINPQYSRGYLGLGSVALQQVGELPKEARAQAAPLVWEGQDWFLTAQRAADRPEKAFVETKVAYGLGLTHLLGADSGIEGFSADESKRFFEQVVEDYAAKGHPAGLLWHHAMARYYLGLLALETDAQAGLAACQRALDDMQQLSARAHPVAISTAYSWECIGRAQARLGRLDRAADAYRNAIRVGEQVVMPEALKLWNDILKQLEKGTPVDATP